MNLSDHCECGHPMTVTLDADGIWIGHGADGDRHDPKRETLPGLAAALDQHHRALLCAKCDGTESFDLDYHFGPR